MSKFPTSNLKPRNAILYKGALDKPSIEVSFASFSLPDPTSDGNELLEFDNPLRAEFIELPSFDPIEIQEHTFDFPVNPVEGYIDASVYFAHVHNPVDITKLKFSRLEEGRIVLTITSRWILSYEGTGFEDFDYTFSVPLLQK